MYHCTNSTYKKQKSPTHAAIQKAQILVRWRSSTISNFKNIRLGLSMMTNLEQFWHFFMITVTSAQSNPLEREKNKNKKRNYFSSSCFNLLRSTNVQSLLKQGKTRLKVCRGCQAFHSEASFSFSFIDHSFMLTRSISLRFFAIFWLPVISLFVFVEGVNNLDNGVPKSIDLEKIDFRNGAEKLGHMDHLFQSYGRIYFK